jgi:hypothetical protein
VKLFVKLYCILLLSLLSNNLFAGIFLNEIDDDPKIDLIVIQDNFISFRCIRATQFKRTQIKAIKNLVNFERIPRRECEDPDHGLIDHDLFGVASHFHLKFKTIDYETLERLFEILAISTTTSEQVLSQYREFKTNLLGPS